MKREEPKLVLRTLYAKSYGATSQSLACHSEAICFQIAKDEGYTGETLFCRSHSFRRKLGIVRFAGGEEVTNSFVSRSALERRTRDGDSPVGENR